MKKIVTLAIVLSSAMALHAQHMAKGYVFEDANNNGKRDRKEAGIAGVSVSNGIAVVQTDEKGRYEIPAGNDNILFVIKPSGYQPPVNEKNQPAFYYIHKPAGSPEYFRFKGVEPTGKLPASVDFPLTKSPDSEHFTALIFGDPQPYNDQEIQYFSKGIVDEVKGIQQVAFGLSLGDLVGDSLDLHTPYIDAVQKVGIPWYNLMGNHDMNYDATADSLSDETYEANFGPANYAFNYGNVHFIILDNILYPDPRDRQGYWGGFRKDQLDFVENTLRYVDKNKLIVLAFHIPLQLNNGNAFRKEDRDRLFSILKDFPHTVSLSAHTHLQRHNFYGAADGWMGSKPHHEYNAGTTSGDWYSGELDEKGIPYSIMRDGTPKGYAFMHFKGNAYVIDYKVAGKPADYQIAVFAPKAITFPRTSSRIYANFFMGHPSSKVEYRIDNSNWQDMRFEEGHDPSYLGLLYKWDITALLMPGRRPSNAVASTHLWSADFPANLSVGKHNIEVRATDMFGRTFTTSKTFEVQKNN